MWKPLYVVRTVSYTHLDVYKRQIYNSASDVFDRNVEACMWNIGLTGNPSLIYIHKEKTFWIYINGNGVHSYREEQKNAVAVKGAAELLAKAEVSDMKECGEGIFLLCPGLDPY